MKMPGFTAEASVYKTSGNYDYIAMSCYNKRGREVMSQLMGGIFDSPRGGGTFGLGDWECINGCEAAYSACLDTCEGTLDNPKPSRNCLICDDIYRACLQACTPIIA